MDRVVALGFACLLAFVNAWPTVAAAQAQTGDAYRGMALYGQLPSPLIDLPSQPWACNQCHGDSPLMDMHTRGSGTPSDPIIPVLLRAAPRDPAYIDFMMHARDDTKPLVVVIEACCIADRPPNNIWGDLGDIAEFLYTCKLGIAPCVTGGGGGGGGGSPGQLQGPPPIAFGSLAVGSTSAPAALMLTNIGSGTVTVASATSSNPGEFPIVGNGCGALAPSEACSVLLSFRPSASGARSATITVTSDGLGSPQAFNVTGTGIGASNYAGLWWNSPANSESGWGINLAHQGDSVFATWYTYDTGGKAWWLSMLANKVTGSTGTYSGAILLSHGSAFNASPFVPSTSPATAGNGTLTFTDSSHGSFDYTVNGVHQAKAITRFDLGTGPMPVCTYSATPDLAGATNYQDLWWVPNGAESGWGVNFAHQGSSTFATWYTYDVDGTPLWLSVLLQRAATSNVYSGDLLRTSGPRFDNFHTSDMKPNQTVGTASVTFTDGNHATFAYTTNGTGGLPAVTHTKEITRFLFSAPAGTVCH